MAKEAIAAMREVIHQVEGEGTPENPGPVKAIVTDIGAVKQEKMAAAASNATTTKFTMYVVLAIAVVAGILVAFLITRMIISSVSKCVELARTIANADLTQTIDLEMRRMTKRASWPWP